jgi:hypothetical protein
MNRKTLSIMVALALMTAAGVVSGYAQETQIQAHVPFAFSVKNSVLPPGDYNLGQLSPCDWVIRNYEGRPAVIALARPGQGNRKAAEDSASLVFERRGDRYFLSQVQLGERTSSIPESKAERVLEREMARSGSKPETIYVLASVR